MSKTSQSKTVRRQFLCMLPLYLIFFILGIARCWVAPIVNEATDPHSELPMTTEQCSWLASLHYASRGLSPILLYLLVDRVGRSPVIIFNAVVLSGMWIVVYWSRDVGVHYIIRLACGLADGLQDSVTSIYVCENCSPQHRGTFFTFAIVLLFAGQCLVFVLATFCSYSTSALIYTVLGVLSLLSTVLLIEPAQFFLIKGDLAKAEKNFGRLRNMMDPASVKEFEDMKRNIAEEKSRKSSLPLFASKEVTRSLRIVMIVMALGSGCGWGPIISFATKLFSNSNSQFSANQLSIFYGVLQLIGVVCSSVIIDRLNRRSLLITSTAVMCVIHSSIAILYCVQSFCELPCFQLILFVLMTSFSCVAAMFLFPMMGLIRGELLPQSVKMLGAGWSTVLLSATSFALIRAFLPIAEAFGTEINFAMYATSAFCLAVYGYFDVPETRGKTLVEIQNELKGADEQKLECHL